MYTNRKLLEPEHNNFETGAPVFHESEINSSLLDQLRIPHLNSEERAKLLKLVQKHGVVFLWKTRNILLSMRLSVKKYDLPIHAKSFCHRAEIQRQISKMLERGIIQHSSSPWTSPVWIMILRNWTVLTKRNGDLWETIENWMKKQSTIDIPFPTQIF